MLDKLELQNFRNYDELNVSCNNSVNVIVGPNGQGKTNFLEAVFFLSMLRSFRTTQIRDLKKIDTPGFMVSGDFKIPGRSWNKKLSVEYLNKRKLTVDGKTVAKSSEFIRQIRTVAFSPDDILIVTGSSMYRRRFIDMLMTTLSLEYLTTLQQYYKALGERNAVLKSAGGDYALLDVYDRILADNGSRIVEMRKRIASILTVNLNRHVKAVIGNDSDVLFVHRCHPETVINSSFCRKLHDDREKDIVRGFTGIGPQLDDFDIMLNSRLLKNYGSSGQCRLLALCLKMAKLELLNESDGIDSNVIALVDDVTGELDIATKTSFYEVISGTDQIFFTFTEIPKENFFEEAVIFSVNEGTIK